MSLLPEVLPENRTAMMAILNITPDSFSDGGQLFNEGLFGEDFNKSVDHILLSAQLALEAGADILDIGGESTRPGAQPVSTDDELCRVIPVIKALKQVFPDAVLSIDTRKAQVARAAVEAGASIINDVSGLQFDGAMASTAAEAAKTHDARLVIMHAQGTPETMQQHPDYPRGVVTEVMNFFSQQTQLAKDAGVPAENIILDPGFGFGKTIDHNLELLKELKLFKALGYPILAGTSRKSFLTLGKSDIIAPAERDTLTAASLMSAIENGADLVRIHNVPALAPVVGLADRLYRRSAPLPV